MSLSELDPKGSQLAKTLAYLCERKGKKDTLEKILTEKGIFDQNAKKLWGIAWKNCDAPEIASMDLEISWSDYAPKVVGGGAPASNPAKSAATPPTPSKNPLPVPPAAANRASGSSSAPAPVPAVATKTPTPVVQATQAAVVSSLPVVNYTPVARREEPLDTAALPGQAEPKILDAVRVNVRPAYKEAEQYVNDELKATHKDLKGKALLEAFVRRRARKRVVMSAAGFKEHNLVEPILIKDEFGEYKFDVLFDTMTISASMTTNDPLPVVWVVGDNTRVEIVVTPAGKGDAGAKSTSDGDPDLLTFLQKVASKNNKRAEKAKDWYDAIRREDTDSLEELLKWTPQEWDGVDKLSLMGKMLIRQELNEYKTNRATESSNVNSTPAERVANLHKVKRYFYWALDLNVEGMPMLSSDAVQMCFDEMAKFYEGDQLLAEIKGFFGAYTLVKTKNIKINRGVLLHGPPGTGKTDITSNVAKRIGLTEVVQPLAAAELNRSLVGQTERLILDLCNRARRVPHLLCCISIDEIDGLAPKRDGNAAGHKVDALSVLLAVIGGIKDVPNLIFLASTNRMHMMDEAFLRRMTAKAFVGRPGPPARKKLLMRVTQEGVRMPPNILDLAITLTTNFSGAALTQLVSNIIVFCRMNGLSEPSIPHLIDICITVAEQFSIRLGSYSLPEVFKNDPVLARGGSSNMMAAFAPNPQLTYTGRVIVDLSAGHMQFELVKARPDQRPTGEDFYTTASVLPLLASFGVNRALDYIQLIDLDLLLALAAYDDNRALENITDRVSECRRYPKSMLIFDLDSLVGVSDNESVSNMGTSKSFSLGNARIFAIAIEAAKKAVYSQTGQEIWCVMISKHPYMTKMYKKAMAWFMTAEEEEALRQEEQAKEALTCKRCKEIYTEAENKFTSCTYHDGFLFNNTLQRQQWRPLSDAEIDKTLLANPDDKGMVYICCLRRYGEAGCKKNKHTPTHNPQEAFEKYMPKLNYLKHHL